MISPRVWWAVAGLVAAVVGVGLSELAAGALTLTSGPLPGVRELAVELLPDEFVVHTGIDLVALATGRLFFVVMLVVLVALSASAGAGAARGWRRPAVLTAAVGGVGAGVAALRSGADRIDLVPVLAGVAGFAAALWLLSRLLERDPVAPTPPALVHAPSRRFVLRAGVLVAVGVAAAVGGEVLGRARQAVERSRQLLRLTMVSSPRVPAGSGVGVEAVAPWMTPTDDFYRVDSALVVPTIEAADWSLRIHGEVERELVIGYARLIEMQVEERWATLVGATNEVGGQRVGNAWWSGVPTRVLLQMAGARPEADVVVQTGADGWRCTTPIQAMSDPVRAGVVAFAMNGEPLSLEHGFPARTVVPGLYGVGAACKWVVEWEVTRSELVAEESPEQLTPSPVLASARIDTPADGAEVPAGVLVAGGVAWAPPEGVGGVEVSLDDGAWQLAVVAQLGLDNSWVQWSAALDLEPGPHTLRVRTRDRAGVVQEEAPADGDAAGQQDGADAERRGAVGLHAIEVEAVEAPEEE